MKHSLAGLCIAGFCAGVVNGLLGAAGGMVLVPLLTALTDLDGSDVFSASISIILPVCLVSIAAIALTGFLPIRTALPYLLGSTAGGILSGKFGHRIPVLWLHRILGIMILWGGFRYLC